MTASGLITNAPKTTNMMSEALHTPVGQQFTPGFVLRSEVCPASRPVSGTAFLARTASIAEETHVEREVSGTEATPRTRGADEVEHCPSTLVGGHTY